jgi:type II secretory pathway component PulM
MAELFHADGRTAFALEILAGIRNHPAIIEETERLLASVEQWAAELPAAEAAAAQQAGAARSIPDLIAAVLAAHN